MTEIASVMVPAGQTLTVVSDDEDQLRLKKEIEHSTKLSSSWLFDPYR